MGKVQDLDCEPASKRRIGEENKRVSRHLGTKYGSSWESVVCILEVCCSLPVFFPRCLNIDFFRLDAK